MTKALFLASSRAKNTASIHLNVTLQAERSTAGALTRRWLLRGLMGSSLAGDQGAALILPLSFRPLRVFLPALRAARCRAPTGWDVPCARGLRVWLLGSEHGWCPALRFGQWEEPALHTGAAWVPQPCVL